MENLQGFPRNLGQAQEMVDQLEELQSLPAFRLVLARLDLLLSQDLRLLEVEQNQGLLRQLQGQVKGRRDALTAATDLIKEIERSFPAEDAEGVVTLTGEVP